MFIEAFQVPVTWNTPKYSLILETIDLNFTGEKKKKKKDVKQDGLSY